MSNESLGNTALDTLQNLQIPVDDIIEIYLTQNGLKPASCFDILVGMEQDGIEGTLCSLREKINSIVAGMGLRFKAGITRPEVKIKPKGSLFWKKIRNVKLIYALSLNNDNLGRLVSVMSSGGSIDDPEYKTEYGLALGYPSEAVHAFNTIRDGIRINGTYKLMCLAKAKKAGIEIPSWLAYTTYVVEDLDIVNGRVSESSKLLGEKYQAFTRQHNPELAQAVESEFNRMLLPDRQNGSYALLFDDPFKLKTS